MALLVGLDRPPRSSARAYAPHPHMPPHPALLASAGSVIAIGDRSLHQTPGFGNSVQDIGRLRPVAVLGLCTAAASAVRVRHHRFNARPSTQANAAPRVPRESGAGSRRAVDSRDLSWCCSALGAGSRLEVTVPWRCEWSNPKQRRGRSANERRRRRCGRCDARHRALTGTTSEENDGPRPRRAVRPRRHFRFVRRPPARTAPRRSLAGAPGRPASACVAAKRRSTLAATESLDRSGGHCLNAIRHDG